MGLSSLTGHLLADASLVSLLCEKTDGLRCLLLCDEDQGKEVHYLIDRKNNYYYVPGMCRLFA